GLAFRASRDNLCGHRALVLGLASDHVYKECLKDHAYWDRKARQLMLDIGGYEGMTYPDFDAFVEHYPAWRVVLMGVIGQLPLPGGVFTGRDWQFSDDPNGDRVIYILHDTTNHHYTYISKIHVFTRSKQKSSRTQWCHGCLTRRVPARDTFSNASLQSHTCVVPKCESCGLHCENERELKKHRKVSGPADARVCPL